MFVANLVFAFVAALLFSVLIAGLIGWRHPADRGDGAAGPALFLFLILFLTAWAGGVWVRPFGPVLWGTSWLPFFLVALLVGLILLAVAAPSRRTATTTGESPSNASAALFGGFFWLLTFGLLIALLVAYMG